MGLYLMLADFHLPRSNPRLEPGKGERSVAVDINVRVCFMSNGEINREALREIYPALSLGCFIRKPVTIEYLVKRIKSELD